MLAQSGRWPSARTVPCWQPPQTTAPHGYGKSPPANKQPSCTTTVASKRWPSARTVPCWQPPQTTAPHGYGKSPPANKQPSCTTTVGSGRWDLVPTASNLSLAAMIDWPEYGRHNGAPPIGQCAPERLTTSFASRGSGVQIPSAPPKSAGQRLTGGH